MEEIKQIWEQQEGEPNEAYARFLVYRNLGPTRTLENAYRCVKVKKGGKRLAPGQWQRDSVGFDWRARATAWDVAQLVNAVPEAATTIFKLINEVARVSLKEILNGNIKPSNFAELKEMVVILASFISPEVISTTIDNAENARSAKDTAANPTISAQLDTAPQSNPA